MTKNASTCRYCGSDVPQDTVALNRKLFENNSKQNHFMCLSCMALVLECTCEDLEAKIEEFKADGCKKFS
jgi:hypothetical protein